MKASSSKDPDYRLSQVFDAAFERWLKRRKFPEHEDGNYRERHNAQARAASKAARRKGRTATVK